MGGKPWLRAIQVALTLGLIGWLALQTDWAALGAVLRGASWGWLLLATALVLISHLLNVLRWRWLVPGRVSFNTLLSYYGAGIFSNNFLPTGVGGDGVRAVLLGKDLSLRHAVWSVALDRVLGLTGLLTFILPGLALGLPSAVTAMLGSLPLSRSWALAGLLLLSGLVAALVVWRAPRLRERALPLFGKLLPGVPEPTSNSRGDQLRPLAGAYGLSILSALGLVLTHACVLLAFDLYRTPGAAIWLVVCGSLAMLLPLSVNGLGVMESVYVLVLANYGVGTPGALSVALTIRALILIFGLAGGALSLRVRVPERGERATKPLS